MTTKREYAISLGLAKPGRGRLSAAAHEAINKAISEGMTFSDSAPAPAEKNDKPKPEPKSSSGDEKNFFGPTPDKRFNGGWYIVVNGKNKSVSGREVCRTCGYSLDYHICNLPTIPDIVSNEMVPVIR